MSIELTVAIEHPDDLKSYLVSDNKYEIAAFSVSINTDINLPSADILINCHHFNIPNENTVINLSGGNGKSADQDKSQNAQSGGNGSPGGKFTLHASGGVLGDGAQSFTINVNGGDGGQGQPGVDGAPGINGVDGTDDQGFCGDTLQAYIQPGNKPTYGSNGGNGYNGGVGGDGGDSGLISISITSLQESHFTLLSIGGKAGTGGVPGQGGPAGINGSTQKKLTLTLCKAPDPGGGPWDEWYRIDNDDDASYKKLPSPPPSNGNPGNPPSGQPINGNAGASHAPILPSASPTETDVIKLFNMNKQDIQHAYIQAKIARNTLARDWLNTVLNTLYPAIYEDEIHPEVAEWKNQAASSSSFSASDIKPFYADKPITSNTESVNEELNQLKL